MIFDLFCDQVDRCKKVEIIARWNEFYKEEYGHVNCNDFNLDKFKKCSSICVKR